MLHEAEKFLVALGGEGPFTFQTFGEGLVKDLSLTSIVHGDISSKLHQLKGLNERGAGIFVMVNQGDLEGRSSSNVLRVRAVFVDLDGSPIEPVLNCPIAPHIVVETSSGKYHAYWIVEDMPMESFKAVQQILARKFNGDPKVCDLPRVMRLPGFYHKKGTPFLTKVLELNSHPIYKSIELFNAFEISPDISDWKETKSILAGERNNKLFVKACGLFSKGFDTESVLARITKINLNDCKPPLDEDEVQKIVRQASGYGANGAIQIDYALFDSPNYKTLSHSAKVLHLAAKRLSKNNSDAIISLTAKDLASFGFKNPKTLARCKNELINAGLLIEVRSASYGVSSVTRLCALFRTAG